MNYKEGETLLACINAAAKLSSKQSMETNEDCTKFVFEVSLNGNHILSFPLFNSHFKPL